MARQSASWFTCSTRCLFTCWYALDSQETGSCQHLRAGMRLTRKRQAHASKFAIVLNLVYNFADYVNEHN